MTPKTALCRADQRRWLSQGPKRAPIPARGRYLKEAVSDLKEAAKKE